MQTITNTSYLLKEEQDHIIESTIEKEGGRLLNFIRRSIPDQGDAEDLLQDVFYQFTQAYRLSKPIEQATSWLYAVARNRITDRFRKKKAIPESRLKSSTDKEEGLSLFDQLIDDGISAEDEMMQDWIMEALDAALEELPENQREVFIWHELEGRSFDEISNMTGQKKNTLISRKRYAVLYLREQLQEMYEEFILD